MANDKPKKPFWKKWWVWAIVIVIVIAAVAGSGDDDEKRAGEAINGQDQDQEVSGGDTLPEESPEPEPEPEWTVIASWSGEGIKATETFETETGEWKINWNAHGEPFEGAGIIQIFVYKENGDLVTLAANIQGESSDSSYVRTPPGKYYLEINSANLKWEVEVEEKI